jgi:NADH:ubiquinone reductase (non-electrogenic)
MKKKVVVLGTGFAAFSFIKDINENLYDIIVVSPRNHFLFTPLLPSTTVGTIEFRSIIEPIRTVRKNQTFIQTSCTGLDPIAKTIQCESTTDKKSFSISYDYLLIAVGATSNTFGVEGVLEYGHFLKDLPDARSIRQRIIDNFEQASMPNIDKEEIMRLLHFVIVGGGATGVEFAAELADFLDDELADAYPNLVGTVRISLIEAAKQILTAFDAELSEYASSLFQRRRIGVLTNTSVRKVTEKILHLADGSELPFGLLVWATGNTATDFIKSLPLPKDKVSRIITDEHLAEYPDVFVMGDCSNMGGKNLPPTAQVAMQQGKYLAKHFNGLFEDVTVKNAEGSFEYHHLGMLAYIGRNRALADLPLAKSHGLGTWLFWRSAYLTRLVSFKNKAQVLFDWTKVKIFGLDVSRF